MITVTTYVCKSCHKRFISTSDRVPECRCSFFSILKPIEWEYVQIGSKKHLNALREEQFGDAMQFTYEVLKKPTKKKTKLLKKKEWYE